MTLTQIKPAGLSKPVDLADNEKIRLGTGNDLEIYHNGSHSIIHDNGTGALKLIADEVALQATNDETTAKFIQNGAVELYHNGTKKFETTSTGVTISNQGNNRILNVHNTNGNNAYIAFLDQNTTDNSYVRVGASANEMMLFAGGSEALRLTSNRDVNIPTDDKKLQLGASQDLQLYHNGTNSYVTTSTGQLFLQSSNSNVWLQGNEGGMLSQDGSEYIIRGTTNGSVKLFYDNVQKFETTSAGVSVTGNIYGSQDLILSAAGAERLNMTHTGGGAFVIKNPSAASLSFGTNNQNNELVIANGGAVCIGTTTNDTGGLVIDKSITAESDASDTANYHLVIRSQTNSNTSKVGIAFKNTSDNAHVGAAILHHRTGGGSVGDLAFYTSPTTGTTTERMRILAGGGITFNGDAAAANALDDYEEGNFVLTPTASSSGSLTLNTSYNQGSYTKIGNKVHIQAYLSFSSNSNAEGYLELNSLPFTPADLADASGHVRAVQVAYLNSNYAYLPDGAGYYNVQLYCNEGSTWIRLYDLNDKGRRLDTLAKFLGSGADIFLNFSYFAA